MDPEELPQRGESFEFPIHVRLSIVPSNYQFVLDPKHGIVSLLIEHPIDGAKVIHQIFNAAALRLLVPIMKSPDFCPYDYLCAAYDSSWKELEMLLKAPELEEVPSFHDLSQRYRQRLEEAQEDVDEWNALLRPIRR